jgi:hypothetical protein
LASLVDRQTKNRAVARGFDDQPIQFSQLDLQIPNLLLDRGRLPDGVFAHRPSVIDLGLRLAAFLLQLVLLGFHFLFGGFHVPPRGFEFRLGHVPLRLQFLDFLFRLQAFLKQSALPLVIDSSLPFLGLVGRDHVLFGLQFRQRAVHHLLSRFDRIIHCHPLHGAAPGEILHK